MDVPEARSTRIDLKDHKLKLEYPCPWEYKVIGTDEVSLRQAVTEVIGLREHTVSLSNTSSRGKYRSLRIELIVISEQQRTGIYHALKAHPNVIMVL